jgi:hypothetical protein
MKGHPNPGSRNAAPAGPALVLVAGAMLLGLAGARAESSLRPPGLSVSIVASNGMPKNIVPRESSWNFGPGSLWTHQGWQYAAYWDEARQVSVARRQLPAGPWAVLSLPGYQRTETENRGKGGLISRGFGDAHEKVSMGISPDGVIHLAFDHHVSALRYQRSKLPAANNPSAHPWTADLFGPVQDHLGGGPLEGVTYPRFTVAGAGMVLYLRMGGGSGGANSHFFSYADGRWSVNTEAASQLIDKYWSGGDGTVNAYPHELVIQHGRRHLTWCWRDTPDERSCHDLCYAYSDDGGRTFLNNEGEVIGVAGTHWITADTPGVAAVTIPPGSRYRNGGSMTVDAAGRVHVLMQGEKGAPVYFTRDPGTGKWSRERSKVLGTLLAGSDDDLYVVTENGIYRTSASRFGRLEKLVAWKAAWFEDSSMVMDRRRFERYGWISVIGQQGKTVRVVDYKLGTPAAPKTKGPSK